MLFQLSFKKSRYVSSGWTMEWVADNSALLEKSTIVQGKRERKLSNKIKWIMEEGVRTPPIPGIGWSERWTTLNSFCL